MEMLVATPKQHLKINSYKTEEYIYIYILIYTGIYIYIYIDRLLSVD